MGSNPASPTTLVFDTSTLQAIYRSGLLPALEAVFESLVPAAVFDENQASLSPAMTGKVPDLERFGWIRVCSLTDADFTAAGAELVKYRRSSNVYRWFGRQIDRPELEAILVAGQRSARLVIEDRHGVKCARDSAVTVLSVAGLLVELEREHGIGNAVSGASKILATGYHSMELWWLSMGLYPQRSPQ